MTRPEQGGDEPRIDPDEEMARAADDVSAMYSVDEIRAFGEARAHHPDAPADTHSDSSEDEAGRSRSGDEARAPGDHGLAAPGRWVPEQRPSGEAALLILTGMSGAGRSTSANVLEDLGWYVVDNLPPRMLPALADLQGEAAADRTDGEPGSGRDSEAPLMRVAAVVDVRTRRFFTELQAAVDQLRDWGRRPTIVFLDATDEALVRRFESVRRPHPLQGEGRLLDGIRRERESLRNVRSEADLVIDSSGFNVHQLAAKVTSLFDASAAAGEPPLMRIAVMSFGFKYGIPLDADFVFDMRFLPNPFWVPELRSHNGREAPVRDFVMSQEGALDFLERLEAAFEPVVAGYRREGRRYVTVAVGCTGGKHRSVAMAEAFAQRLADHGVQAFTVHRDLGRE